MFVQRRLSIQVSFLENAIVFDIQNAFNQSVKSECWKKIEGSLCALQISGFREQSTATEILKKNKKSSLV
jgi:hypothetical protein